VVRRELLTLHGVSKKTFQGVTLIEGNAEFKLSNVEETNADLILTLEFVTKKKGWLEDTLEIKTSLPPPLSRILLPVHGLTTK